MSYELEHDFEQMSPNTCTLAHILRHSHSPAPSPSVNALLEASALFGRDKSYRDPRTSRALARLRSDQCPGQGPQPHFTPSALRYCSSPRARNLEINGLPLSGYFTLFSSAWIVSPFIPSYTFPIYSAHTRTNKSWPYKLQKIAHSLRCTYVYRKETQCWLKKKSTTVRLKQ